MKTVEEARTAVAVIIGRWQIDALHGAHKMLIDHVFESHTKVIVMIGVSHFLGSIENPLDYPSRARLIQENYPNAIVLPILDNNSDEVWSKNVDLLIRQAAPIGKVTIYGGRDSFVSHYHGRFHTVELDAISDQSGTARRLLVGREVRGSEDFRAGVIYSTQNVRGRSFPVVDIARFTWASGRWYALMGLKPNETLYRFPGGFVDKGETAEAAAVRELAEETNIFHREEELIFWGTYNIPDRRLGKEESMLSTFFLIEGPYIEDLPPAGDDLGKTFWVDIRKEPLNNIMPNHLPMFKKLRAHVARKDEVWLAERKRREN